MLGHNWHYRGSNSAGDFCFVIRETVEFYLCRKRPLIQYIPNGNQNPTRVSTPQGYALVFKYVRGDGTPSQFGKLDDVFT